MILEFRLSPPGSKRGVSCDENGAFVGAIPLLERSRAHGKNRWRPRDCAELSKQLGSHYALPIDMSSKTGRLKAIANALNDGDLARAQIATVLLGIPDPPMFSKRTLSRSEAIKFIRDLHWSGLIKADWDADDHPRWPAGSPDSQGGQFSPKGNNTSGQSNLDDAFDQNSRPDRNAANGYMQLAQSDSETDEPEPAVNGQTEAESRAASEIDNAAGELLSRDKAAEAAGGETRAQSQSRIDRQDFDRLRGQIWRHEATADPQHRQLPPDCYTDSNLALMRSGQAPIGEDGFPMELHHVDGSPWGPLVPMTRTDHRLGTNYLLNHPWLYGKMMMIDIFVDKLNTARTFAGIFEADDTVSYFYLYGLAEGANGHIAGAVQVYRGLPNFGQSDVEVRWFDDETKVGVFIKGELGAYFDLVSGWGYPGTYSRHQPAS